MKGFSFVEIMVVLAIISILATLAYPSYQESLYKTRRSDGHIALLTLATALEAYYLEHQSYSGATSPQNIGTSPLSPQGFYKLSLTTPTPQSYILIASPHPEKPQKDDPCGDLTLNHKNEKGAKLANCW